MKNRPSIEDALRIIHGAIEARRSDIEFHKSKGFEVAERCARAQLAQLLDVLDILALSGSDVSEGE